MAEKKHRRTNLIKDKGYISEVKMLRKMKVPYSVSMSNYTVGIETAATKNVYIKKEQSLQLFAAYAKIKADVKKKPIPKIDKDNLSYFVCKGFRQDFFFNVHNLDLKAAYANALYLNGKISDNTMSYIMQIPKQDRLAAVGMLASRKIIFHYDKKGDQIGDPEIIESDLQNFFWYAVRKTYLRMKELEYMAGKHFLFSWVDGVYFNGGNDLVENMKFIIENNFKMAYSYEHFDTADIVEKNNSYLVSLEKDGEIKPFNLPKPERLINKIFHEIIVNKFS